MWGKHGRAERLWAGIDTCPHGPITTEPIWIERCYGYHFAHGMSSTP